MNSTFFSPALKDEMSDGGRIKRGFFPENNAKVMLSKVEVIPGSRAIIKHLSRVKLIMRHNITYNI
jgi:hypothetical protein